jgi:hypothetical protein
MNRKGRYLKESLQIGLLRGTEYDKLISKIIKLAVYFEIIE